MNNGSFKGRSQEDRIVLWGHMDDIVMSLRNTHARNLWRKEGVPRLVNGDSFIVSDNTSWDQHELNYDLVTINRFWWKSEFSQCDWNRIEKAFAKCIKLGIEDGNE